MQRYVAACGAVFMHKQAGLSIPRCKPLHMVVSPETTGAPRMLQRYQVAAGVLVPLGSQPPSPHEALKASPPTPRQGGQEGTQVSPTRAWELALSLLFGGDNSRVMETWPALAWPL